MKQKKGGKNGMLKAKQNKQIKKQNKQNREDRMKSYSKLE